MAASYFAHRARAKKSKKLGKQETPYRKRNLLMKDRMQVACAEVAASPIVPWDIVKKARHRSSIRRSYSALNQSPTHSV